MDEINRVNQAFGLMLFIEKRTTFDKWFILQWFQRRNSAFNGISPSLMISRGRFNEVKRHVIKLLGSDDIANNDILDKDGYKEE